MDAKDFVAPRGTRIGSTLAFLGIRVDGVRERVRFQQQNRPSLASVTVWLRREHLPLIDTRHHERLRPGWRKHAGVLVQLRTDESDARTAEPTSSRSYPTPLRESATQRRVWAWLGAEYGAGTAVFLLYAGSPPVRGVTSSGRGVLFRARSPRYVVKQGWILATKPQLPRDPRP